MGCRSRRIVSWALLPALVAFGGMRPCVGSEIPPDLDRLQPAVREAGMARASASFEAAGLSAIEATARSRALDPAELARAERTDPARRGGDAIVTVAVVAAIVVIVVVFVQYMQEQGKK